MGAALKERAPAIPPPPPGFTLDVDELVDLRDLLKDSAQSLQRELSGKPTDRRGVVMEVPPPPSGFTLDTDLKEKPSIIEAMKMTASKLLRGETIESGSEPQSPKEKYVSPVEKAFLKFFVEDPQQGAIVIRDYMADKLAETRSQEGNLSGTRESIFQEAEKTGKVPYGRILNRTIAESLTMSAPITPVEIAEFAVAGRFISSGAKALVEAYPVLGRSLGEIGQVMKEWVTTKKVNIDVSPDELKDFFVFGKEKMSPRTYQILQDMDPEILKEMVKQRKGVTAEVRVPRFGEKGDVADIVRSTSGSAPEGGAMKEAFEKAVAKKGVGTPKTEVPAPPPGYVVDEAPATPTEVSTARTEVPPPPAGYVIDPVERTETPVSEVAAAEPPVITPKETEKPEIQQVAASETTVEAEQPKSRFIEAGDWKYEVTPSNAVYGLSGGGGRLSTPSVVYQGGRWVSYFDRKQPMSEMPKLKDLYEKLVEIKPEVTQTAPAAESEVPKVEKVFKPQPKQEEPLSEAPELKVTAGQIKTRSGRDIPAPPPVRLDSNRKATNDVAKVDAWLVEQARAEAAARNDDFNATTFGQMNPKRLSQADKDSANQYLFGHENPKIMAEDAPNLTQEQLAKHRDDLLKKAADYDAKKLGAKITDVTPAGYGPEPTTTSATPPETAGKTPVTPLKKTYKPIKQTEAVEGLIKTAGSKSRLPIIQRIVVHKGVATSTDLEVTLEKKLDKPDGVYKVIGKNLEPDTALTRDDAPVIPTAEKELGTVDRDDFIRNVERVSLAESTDPTRFVLNGVALRVKDGKASLAATDGRRLSVSPLDSGKLSDGEYIIPRAKKVLTALKSLPSGELKVKTSKEGRDLRFESPDGAVTVRLIEGQYPNFQQVIPRPEEQFAVPRESLSNALKELAPYAKEKENSQIVISTSKDTLTIEAHYGENQTKTVTLPLSDVAKGNYGKMTAGSLVMPMRLESTGKDRMAFNLDYLRDAVSGVTSDKVYIGRTSENEPIVVKGTPFETHIEPQKPAKKPRKPRVAAGSATTGAAPMEAFETVTPEKPSPREGKPFKLFEETKAMIQKYAERVGEGYVPRHAEGVFYPGTDNIRLRALNNLSTAVHEVSHFIDKKGVITEVLLETVGQSKDGKPIYNPKTLKTRQLLSEIYLEYYPTALETDPLRERMVEGFATLVQKYAEVPTQIREKYPELVRDFLTEGGKYNRPVINELLKDARQIIGKYQALDPLAKVGSRVTSDFQQKEIKDTFLKFWDKVYEVTIDQVWPIAKMGKEAGKARTADDPSLWVRQYHNAKTIIMNNISGDRGFWTLKGEKFVKVSDKTIRNLYKTLQKKASVDDFAHWLVARREHFAYKKLDALKPGAIEAAKRLREIAEDPVVAIHTKKSEIRELKQIVESYKKLRDVLRKDAFSREVVTKAYEDHLERFKEDAELFDTFTKADLDMLNDTGLITGKSYSELSDVDGYAAFKRDIYDEVIGAGEPHLPETRLGGVKVSATMRRVGSQLAILNPLYSLAVDHAEVMRKGLKQMVYNKMAELLHEFPDMIPHQRIPLEPRVDKETGAITYPQDKDPNIMMARTKDGKRVPYLMSQEIKSVLDSTLNAQNLHIFERFLRGGGRLFTAGTTALYPLFAPTNIVIDQFSALSNTRNKLVPIYDQISLLIKTVMKTDPETSRFVEEYFALGGERQTLVKTLDMSPDDFAKTLTREVEGIGHVLKAGETVLKIVEWPSSKSEVLTRAAEYVRSRQAGNPQIVAMEDAGEVTIPFHHIGSWGGHVGQTLIKSVGFMNAGVQAAVKAFRAGTGEDTRKRFWFVTMATVASVVGMFGYLMRKMTDDQRELYDNLEAGELARYAWFPHPDGKRLVRVRIPESAGSLAGPINMALSEMIKGTDYNAVDYMDAVTTFLPNQFDVTDPERMLFTMMPQVIKGPIEAAANVKDYPRIRPLVNDSLKHREPRAQYYDNTSDFGKWLGEKLNLSPIKIDFLIEGYLGRTTRFVTGKPIQNPFVREYYFTAGRNLQDYYEYAGEIKGEYDSLKRGERDFSDAERERIQDKYSIVRGIDRLLDRYREIEKGIKREADPEAAKQEADEYVKQLRREILDAIGSLRDAKGDK